MNTILAASMVTSGPSSTTVRQGASQVPFTKALSQNTKAVFPTELKPVTNVRIAIQGSTDQFVVVSHYGPCVEVPDGHDMPGLQPYYSMQMLDDFRLPIAGSPASGQKGIMVQTAAGDSILYGTTSTSPDGVTSPAIPNTGDVTPGTAAPNPATVTSGPPTKQHPWITDVVTGHGMMQTAYGKYDYTDPTGTVHTSLSKGDKKVKKPLLDVKLSTNTTAPYSGMTPVAGLTPTQYPDSLLEFSLVSAGGNDGLRVRVGKGLTGDADNRLDIQLYAQQTQPYSTSVALPGITPTEYPLNGLMLGDGTSGGGNNQGLGVNAKYGITVDDSNYLDTLFAATASVRSGWGKLLQTMKGYDPQKYNASGMKHGGDSGFGLRLNLAAYQTPSTTGLFAPIITDTVTRLQDAEGTKKLVSGLRVDGGDDQSGVRIDIAVNAAGKPLGVKIGQGVDGNGLAAFPDMKTIDYRASDGALEAMGLATPPSPPGVTGPPSTGTDPPGTVCAPPVTAPDGTIYQDCTTTTSGGAGGTGSGSTYVPPPTIPNGGGSAPGPGNAGQPGYDCSGAASTPLTLGTITNLSGGDNLIGPAGFTMRSHTNETLVVDVPAHVSNTGIWLQGHVAINAAPYFGTYIGLDTGFSSGLDFNILGLVASGYGGGGTANQWFLRQGSTTLGICNVQGIDLHFGFWVNCSRQLQVYLGTSETDLTLQGTIPFTIVGDLTNWQFKVSGTNVATEQVFLTVDGVLAYTSRPAGVTLRNTDGTIAYTGDGTTMTNPDPSAQPGPGTQTTTTTATPPSTVSGNLSVDGGIYVNGNPMTGIITAVDISAPFALTPDSFMKITDPFTGVDYVSPVSMYPNGQPGAMSGGYFWPGA